MHRLALVSLLFVLAACGSTQDGNALDGEEEVPAETGGTSGSGMGGSTARADSGAGGAKTGGSSGTGGSSKGGDAGAVRTGGSTGTGGTPPLDAVVIDVSKTLQTVIGLGGNFGGQADAAGRSKLDAVATYCLANLNPKHARVGLPLQAWEPSNDDGDPAAINWAAFATTNASVKNVFSRLQDFANKSIPVTLTIWDVPNWMVVDPSQTRGRTIAPAMYAEVAESIATFLSYARDNYGVNNIDALSFNEMSWGVNIGFSASEYAAFVQAVGPKLKAQGVTSTWLGGTDGEVGATTNYAEAALGGAAAPFIGPISIHPWGALDTSDDTYKAIADLAEKHSREVWCEEAGYDAFLWQNASAFSTWDYAITLARLYHKVLKHGRVTVADYWEYWNDYPLATTSGTPYPAFHVVKALADHLPGMRQVTSSDNTDARGVDVMAFQHPTTGALLLHAINTSDQAQSVTFAGVPDVPLALTRSSASEDGALADTVTPTAGLLTVSLPAGSVSTFVGG
jgi:O-glycosyl hydrolase